MSVTFFNEGITRERDRLLGIEATATLKVLLFTAPTSLSGSTVYADFTEVTVGALPGYARVTLTPGNWVLSFTSPVARGVYPTITWSFSANAGVTTIYGYAVVDETGTTVGLWGELFGAGITVPAVGMDLNLTLTYDHEQCP